MAFQRLWQTSQMVDVAPFPNDFVNDFLVWEVVALVTLHSFWWLQFKTGRALSQAFFLPFSVLFTSLPQCLEVITVWTNTRWESSSVRQIVMPAPSLRPEDCLILLFLPCFYSLSALANIRKNNKTGMCRLICLSLSLIFPVLLYSELPSYWCSYIAFPWKNSFNWFVILDIDQLMTIAAIVFLYFISNPFF